MDMKNPNSWRPHFKGKKRRKGDTGQLAAQLAPLEEQNKPAAESQLGTPLETAGNQVDGRFGDIIVDNDDLKVPADIMETPGGRHFLGIEPVVLVVLILMLVFIAFITWQITLLPAQ